MSQAISPYIDPSAAIDALTEAYGSQLQYMTRVYKLLILSILSTVLYGRCSNPFYSIADDLALRLKAGLEVPTHFYNLLIALDTCPQSALLQLIESITAQLIAEGL